MDPRSIYVAILCALYEEAAAVESMLDHVYTSVEATDITDDNAYTIGVIDGKDVVVACLPDGRMGEDMAAVTATDLVRSFPSIKFAMFVGIGGGIPSNENDIRLGDVVVSRPNATSTTASVIRYDLGRQNQDGTFQKLGQSSDPPQAILSAVGKVRRRHTLSTPAFVGYIQSALDHPDRPPEFRDDFSRPAVDRLFKPSALHAKGEPTCANCDKGAEVERNQRSRSKVHYGTIASGNTVMKDANLRDRLGKELGAICFEMEASGTMLKLPCLVIRGISDYCDSHKNNDWRYYAALAAAAYARELITYIPKQNIQQSQSVAETLNELGITVKQNLELNKSIAVTMQQIQLEGQDKVQRKAEEARRRLISQFHISTYENSKNSIAKRVRNTGLWALQHNLWQRWTQSEHNDLLVVTADPGCGKSVLARAVIDDDLREISLRQNAIISYFFFRSSTNETEVCRAICAIIHQVFAACPELARHAESVDDMALLVKDVSKLCGIFQKITADRNRPNLYCIIDGLDECRASERTTLIQMLRGYYERPYSTASQQPWTKICVTSRSYLEIIDLFGQQLSHIRLKGEEETGTINSEINRVIRSRVADTPDVQNMSFGDQEEIISKLESVPNRTYLWVDLALEHILGEIRLHGRRALRDLDSVPFTVEEAYDKLLQKVLDGTHTRRARNIFSIMVATERPFTIPSLCIALQILDSLEPGSHGIPELAGMEENPQFDELFVKRHIRDWCGLFVFEQDNELYFLHETAKAFLSPKQQRSELIETTRPKLRFAHSISNDAAHATLAQAFLGFLSATDLIDFMRSKLPNDIADLRTTGDPVALRDRLERHPMTDFCRLATDHWLPHTYAAQDEWPEKLSRLGFKLHTESSTSVLRLLYNWEIPLVYDNLDYHNSRMIRASLPVMHGLYRVLESLLAAPTPYGKAILDYRDSMDYTLIHWATRPAMKRYNRDMTLQTLFRAGIDINHIPREGDTALHQCCREKKVEEVHILLNAGASVHSKEKSGRTPLVDILGWCVGHAFHFPNQICDIVEALLAHGADINAADNFGMSLIGYLLHQEECEAGRLSMQILEKLLRCGADIFLEDTEGHSPWEVACQISPHSDRNAVKLVRDLGLVKKTAHKLSALRHYAAFEDARKFSRLLDYCQRHPEQQHDSFDECLIVAAGSGRADIMKVLLDHGVNINHINDDGETPLIATCLSIWPGRHVSPTTVEQLVRHGADINLRTRAHGTALHIAAGRGHQQMAEVLLYNGADINVTAYHHGSILASAPYSPDRGWLGWLMDKGASVTANEARDGKEAYNAACLGWLAHLDFMVSLGADPHAQAGYFGTPLQGAAAHGRYTEVKYLVERHGVALNVTEPRGTALCHAVFVDARITGRQRYELVQLLVSKGAEVNKCGPNGSPLHMVLKNPVLRIDERIQIIDLLLSRGADVDVQGPEGTPLTLASSIDGHNEIVNLLIRKNANVNTINSNGSPLHSAALNLSFENAATLLTKSANANAHAGKGTPIQAALWPTYVWRDLRNDPRPYTQQDEYGQPCSRCDQEPWTRESDYCTYHPRQTRQVKEHLCSRWSELDDSKVSEDTGLGIILTPSPELKRDSEPNVFEDAMTDATPLSPLTTRSSTIATPSTEQHDSPLQRHLSPDLAEGARRKDSHPSRSPRLSPRTSPRFTDGAQSFLHRKQDEAARTWRIGDDRWHQERIWTVKALLKGGSDVDLPGPMGSARELAGRWEAGELREVVERWDLVVYEGEETDLSDDG